ncbi:TRAP transporter large permease subunit [Desulfobacula sp.]|uniref:TRAP transporter large permease n=1 Tax=Desulfobacula sp. TaxID=2593537 RepID=UPI0026171CCE|nr:TRAP transporter large permease subunit [Desulfobacula sp.]
MKKIFEIMECILDKILSAMGFISVALMVLLSLFISTQVFCRYFLSMHIPGLFDLAIYSLILFTFLSAPYALREGQHICVDLFFNHLSDSAKAGLKISTYAIALFYVIVLGWVSWKWAWNSFSSGAMTISEVPIPKGLLISSISLGSLLLFLQLLRMMVSVSIQSAPLFKVKNFCTGPSKNPSLFIAIFMAVLILGFLFTVYGNAIGGICFIALLVLLCGMPVFLALGFVGSVGMILLIGESTLKQLPFLAYKSVESFPLTCLPLFIIAGIIMERGKIVDDVFLFFRYFAGNFISAPLISTILVGGFFCAISGSSVATTSLIAAVSLPILISNGYKRSISSGVVAGSTIGTVIPPSIGYVLYGVITEESIGQLFIAGMIPAVMIFGFYCLYILIRSKINAASLFEKGQVPEQIDWKDMPEVNKLAILMRASCGLLAPVFVLGGIYMGIFTPTEAAAIMVIYAIVITILIMKSVTWPQLFEIILTGTKISSMILIIIVGARIFGALTSQMGIAADLVDFVKTSQISPVKTLLVISGMLVILGMFLDAASIMVITLPVVYPVIMAAGFNSVWFGVFFIIVLEIGLLTPPVGLNLFIIKGLSNFDMGTIIRGTVPFILIMVLSLYILTLFPELATWLPSLMVQ